MLYELMVRMLHKLLPDVGIPHCVCCVSGKERMGNSCVIELYRCVLTCVVNLLALNMSLASNRIVVLASLQTSPSVAVQSVGGA